MWRYCMILALLSVLLLLCDGRHHHSVEIEAASTEAFAHAGPAAIMFGNPRPLQRLRFSPKRTHNNKDQGNRDRKRKHHKHQSSTRATTRNSFKHH
ncbi:uncharacterized protein Dmoj_GI25907 [Drosophila mojavensis]|uniref:Secreted protein n=1 Tax=Drosophila mojavensis TaxID=7230 RepID=A0A0Q9XAP5_DROMO|nr:uncharacterized protein Dmoj_GI25907 [Drosophila mojavensis]